MSGSLTEAMYQSYLLRCWCDGSKNDEGSWAWRLSIAKVGSNEEAATFLRGIDELTKYVQQQLAGLERDGSPLDGPDKRQV